MSKSNAFCTSKSAMIRIHKCSKIISLNYLAIRQDYQSIVSRLLDVDTRDVIGRPVMLKVGAVSELCGILFFSWDNTESGAIYQCYEHIKQVFIFPRMWRKMIVNVVDDRVEGTRGGLCTPSSTCSHMTLPPPTHVSCASAFP